MDHIHKNEIKERDITAEQQHRNDDDQGRVNQLLVFADPFFLRVPRPGSFLELDLNFVEKVFSFSDHDVDFVIVDLAGKSRQEGLEPPTGGFGDRYSTN